eukprot:g614.t1
MLLLARGGIDVALKMFRGSRGADEARQSDEPLDSFARRFDAISTSFIERSEIVLDSKTENTDGDNPFSPDAMRRRKRKKIDGAISGLVEISGMLRGLAEGRTTLREGTIFEVIINPLINILSALMPEFLYIITKEMIVALIEYILEQLMLPVFTQPALASLVPPRAGAKPLLKKTCRKDRSIKCATDKDCADKKPCDTGKTCAKDRNVLCNTDADCKESPTSDLSPCNTGKTCAKDRSIECATDEECDDKAPCDTGKTCAKDRSIKCATDEECADKAPCNTGKTCAKDRSIKCATDEECDDKAPCNNDTGKTCAKDRSIKCATDEECADKAPCDTGKTCAKDRSIKCATDEECDDKAPCNTGKTCAKDRSIECATDEECDDKAPCNSGRIVRRRSRGFVDIFPTEATPSDGVIVSRTAYGSGDVGLDSTAGSVGKLSCENDCEEEEEESEGNEGVPTHVASSNNPNGPLQPDADPPSAFAELETKHRAGPVPDVAANFDLAMMLTVSITDAVADDLSAAIRKRFDDFLGIRARQAIVRSSSRALTTRLTATLGSSLSRMLVELLTLSMTVVPTKKITAALIPSLTSSIVPVVTHALKHDPKSDYYCYYCLHESVYCDLCEKAELEIAFLDQQARYYSAYYSEYYSAHYSSDESAARDYFGRGRRAGNV